MQLSHTEAEKDEVVVPTTTEEYCMKPKPRPGAGGILGVGGEIEMDDFYDDDCYDLDEDDEEEDSDDEEGKADPAGDDESQVGGR